MKILFLLIIIIFTNDLWSNEITYLKKYYNPINKTSKIMVIKSKHEVDLNSYIINKKNENNNTVNIIDVFYNQNIKSICLKNNEDYNIIVVSDLLGKVLLNENIADKLDNTIPLKLESGLYIISFINDNTKFTKKLIIN